MPIPPLVPNAPLWSWLEGSPIDAGSIKTDGESNATVTGIGSFGSASVLGGMNVRSAFGGGAPFRAGSAVLSLPPNRAGAAREECHSSGIVSLVMSTESAQAGCTGRQVTKKTIPARKACKTSDNVCDFAVGTPAGDATQKPAVN